MGTKNQSKNLKEKRDKYIDRLDGRIEWVCEHGIGHTTPESAISCADKYKEYEKGYATRDEVISAWRSHGCDGCCKWMYNRKNCG